MLGPRDAVIDTSGYIPREVLAACMHLEPLARQYVFMSTVSVYRGWPSELLSEASEVYCPANAGPDYGDDVVRRAEADITAAGPWVWRSGTSARCAVPCMG